MATTKSKVARKAKRKPVGATKPRPVKKTRLQRRHAVAKVKVPGTKAGSRTAKPQIVVVNMIPNSLSGESHQDSEPTLTVNPANPLQIAASAFTPDPAGGDIAPIYVSVDGGMSWSLNSIVPSSAADGSATADITVAFGSSSNRLYAGIIRLPYPADRTRLNILRTDDFRGGTVMKVLVDRTGKGVDQPYVQAITVAGGPDKGKDRLYVGDNDFSSPGSTATIDQSLDAGRPNPSFTSVRIEERATSGQDGPSIRPAIHADGTVYAVFHSWRTFSNSTGHGTADVVVVRDDNGGAGAHPFTALLDPGDGKAGVRVAQGVKFNFDGFLGLQRTGGDVNIAVDPTNSANVYVAYNADEGSDYVLHLCQSADRGATWSVDVRTLRNALNPSLAVNNAGTLGLLYQQLTGTGAAQRWVTKFESTKNGSTWTAATLANVPANEPVKQFDPYLGDYEHLTAVGKNFYGIFCANNAPKKANFPQGVKYQRNANFATGTLLDVDNTTPVHISIDPFFFKVTT
jgi:hypothetical protein